MWFLNLHAYNKYNVKSVYSYLLSSINITAADHTNVVWNKGVPLKVSLFARLLLRNRLLITDNSIRRHVLHPNAQASTLYKRVWHYGGYYHLFLSCNLFRKVWLGISNWLGFSTVHLKHVANHFLQLENLVWFPQSICVTF